MDSILYHTKPSIKQMFLDPRTKILLCLVVSFVTFSSGNTRVMHYVLPILAIIPLAAIIILKKPLIAIYYASMYLFSIIVPPLLMGMINITNELSASALSRGLNSPV